jgi:hypothetical protein
MDFVHDQAIELVNLNVLLLWFKDRGPYVCPFGAVNSLLDAAVV